MKGRTIYHIPFSKYPAVRVAILLIFGILAGEAFSGGFWVPIYLFGGLAFTVLFLGGRNRNTPNLLVLRVSTILFLFSIIVFGWFRVSIQNTRPAIYTEDLLALADWEEIYATGIVNTTSKSTTGKTRADVWLQSVSYKEAHSSESFKIRLLFNEDYPIVSGDTLSFKATIIPVGEKRNPHQFDYKKYLYQRGIRVQLRLDSLYNHSINQNKLTFSWWQNQALQIVEKQFSRASAPIAKALLFGFKQDMEVESRQAFARAGLSHIMAVSGLHVGFIVAPFWLFIPYFWSSKRGRIMGLIVLLAILYGYAGITGFSPSVNRASLTALLLTFGKLFNKSPNSINLTAVAAILMLLYNPAELYDIGFQLSFSAVFIILLVLPTVQYWLPRWIRFRWYAKPLMVVIVSIVVQLGLYPLQVYYFGEVSFVSPIANALFIPFLGLVVPIALLGVIISSFFTIIGGFICWLPDLFLQFMNGFVMQASSWTWAWKSFSVGSILIFPLWITMTLGLASWRIPAVRWKFAILSLGLISMIQIQNLIGQMKPGELTITVFDVGQGDATLIESPNGGTVLIDAGVWTPGGNSAQSVLLPHFIEAGIAKLDAVILTHPHADHIGGILDLIKSIPIDTIYNSGFTYDSNLFRSYLRATEQANIPVKSITAGDVINIDPAVLLLVLAPEGGRFNTDPNQHSVVLEIVYGTTEFLFTGDAGEQQESRLIENYTTLLDSDFLKVGHHGSRTSSGTEFLELVTPDIAAVSLAEQNRFNHPHAEAMTRLYQNSAAIYFTSRDRALIFKSDGRRIWREGWD